MNTGCVAARSPRAWVIGDHRSTRWAQFGPFLEFAVQGGDGAVAFAQRGPEFGDLGVFGGQPGPQRGDDAGFGPGRWWVVGNGHDRAVGVDESQQVLAAVDALAGYPGAAGDAADGDVGVLLTQVAQRFLDPGADGVAAFTGVGGQSVQRGLGDGRNSCG